MGGDRVDARPALFVRERPADRLELADGKPWIIHADTSLH
jgi:hypothetical protein